MDFGIFTLLILILSVILHEVAHGYAAHSLGDPTARLAGRLNLNPLVHIDPLGSIIIPAFLLLTNSSFLFGWAKPVPYNPYNLRNQRWSEAFVAAAGPLTNFLLAFIFAMLVRFSSVLSLSSAFVEMAVYVVFINILLALFNAIPLPPLDGSKIIVPFLPYSLQMRYREFTKYMEHLGIMGLLLLVFIFIQILQVPFSKLVFTTLHLFIGQ